MYLDPFSIKVPTAVTIVSVTVEQGNDMKSEFPWQLYSGGILRSTRKYN